MIFFVNIDENEQSVWISEENTSGAEYPCKNAKELKDAFSKYVDNYIPEKF